MNLAYHIAWYKWNDAVKYLASLEGKDEHWLSLQYSDGTYLMVDTAYLEGYSSVKHQTFALKKYEAAEVKYPGIETLTARDINGRFNFRFLYYPTVDSLVITADGGKYLFMDVLIENLQNYYIEFEYDGLTYTNVTPHIDVDNGSKATENAEERSAFNRSFSTIEGTSETAGVALDENGNVAHELQYTKDTEQHRSTLINEGLPVGQYPITANTDETGYRIIDHFETGTEEIPYINLGLYEREQPDLALIKDMKNVRLAINGYQHIYEYEQRFQNQGEYGDGFNVGVKFGSEYDSQSYTRAIYKADYEYVNEEDASRELKVYVTYRIAVRNEATTLTSQINSIVDYFDSRYTMVAVGTGIDQEGIITGSIDYTQEAYNDEYARAVIYTNTRLEAQTQSDIYVQFELNREAVLNILNDGENLENVVEINSYSTFDENGGAYAGVDVDSNPGNAIPGDRATYEDDTDSSPSLKLEVADAREIAGKVFLDSTSGELMTGQIRQGSGAYEEGETGILGVIVTLTENTGTGLTYTATTDDNGDFVISDFIPGDYTLTYTWGDTTYTVQNYKGTVYDKDRYDANVANKEWYKDDVETRWTDAVDDYATRLQIDSELTEITSSTDRYIKIVGTGNSSDQTLVIKEIRAYGERRLPELEALQRLVDYAETIEKGINNDTDYAQFQNALENAYAALEETSPDTVNTAYWNLYDAIVELNISDVHNVALNKPTEASNDPDGHSEGMVDGTTSTNWNSGRLSIPGKPYDHDTLLPGENIIDLEDVYNINELRIYFGSSSIWYNYAVFSEKLSFFIRFMCRIRHLFKRTS